MLDHGNIVALLTHQMTMSSIIRYIDSSHRTEKTAARNIESGCRKGRGIAATLQRPGYELMRDNEVEVV